MRKTAALLIGAAALAPSCHVLEDSVGVVNPATGEVEERRVGDVLADTVDTYAQPTSSVVSAAVPNPIAGAGIGAALLAAAGAASAALRKRREE